MHERDTYEGDTNGFGACFALSSSVMGAFTLPYSFSEVVPPHLAGSVGGGPLLSECFEE